MRIRAALILAVVVVSLASVACGYALAGRGSFLPPDIRVVGIPLFENRTNITRIEQIITEKIRTEFIQRGNKYDIRPTTTGADAVLTGTITALVTQPVGFTEQQLASRYLFTVTMRVQLNHARTNEVLWSNESLTFREEYDTRTRGTTQLDTAVLLEQEGPAVERLSTELARHVVSAILEAF
jgi:hypothetical protein